jgi:hypothetical protein
LCLIFFFYFFFFFLPRIHVYLLAHHFIYPIFEVCNTCINCVCFAGAASWRTMADRSVQFPTAVHLANKRTTTVTMTATLTGYTSIATANHSVGNWNSNSREVLSVAYFIADYGHFCLLQYMISIAGMSNFSPTSNVTVRPHWYIFLR